MAPRLALVIAGVFLLVQVSVAYPVYWLEEYSKNCTDHPAAPDALHKAPIVDGAVRFTINGSQSTTFCPGKEQTLEVVFPEIRAALLTATVGIFAGAPDVKCPQRLFWTSGNTTNTAATKWTVPCNATMPVTLKVTSAKGEADNFRQTTITLLPDPACAAACGTAGASNATRMANMPAPAGGASNATNTTRNVTGMSGPSPTSTISSPAATPAGAPSTAGASGLAYSGICQGLVTLVAVVLLLHML